MKAESKLNPMQIASWVIMAALAVVNILLIQQNLALRAEINKSRPDSLQPGDLVPSFSAIDLKGNAVNINYSSKEATRVLLFFTPTCPYCQEQFPYWRKLLEQANRNQFQLLGMVAETENRSKVEEYLRAVGCEGLRVAFVPKDVFASYKLSVTPTTLVISNQGKVDQIWIGKWDTSIVPAASSFFGFQL